MACIMFPTHVAVLTRAPREDQDTLSTEYEADLTLNTSVLPMEFLSLG